MFFVVLVSPARGPGQGQGHLALPPHINIANAAPIDPHADAKLLLHHNNMTTTDPLDVTCMDINPQGGLLATGCDDGVVRLWRYGGISTANLVGSKKEIVHPDKDWETMRESGYTERSVRTLKCTDQHLLKQLQGHVAKVTGRKRWSLTPNPNPNPTRTEPQSLNHRHHLILIATQPVLQTLTFLSNFLSHRTFSIVFFCRTIIPSFFVCRRAIFSRGRSYRLRQHEGWHCPYLVLHQRLPKRRSHHVGHVE